MQKQQGIDSVIYSVNALSGIMGRNPSIELFRAVGKILHGKKESTQVDLDPLDFLSSGQTFDSVLSLLQENYTHYYNSIEELEITSNVLSLVTMISKFPSVLATF